MTTPQTMIAAAFHGTTRRPRRALAALRALMAMPATIAALEGRVDQLEEELADARKEVEDLQDELREAERDIEEKADQRDIERAVEDLDFASKEDLDDLRHTVENECANESDVDDLKDKVGALTVLAGLATYRSVPVNEGIEFETVEADIRRACEELGFGFKAPAGPPSRGILLREEGRA